jgi:hypothetical protein
MTALDIFSFGALEVVGASILATGFLVYFVVIGRWRLWREKKRPL